MLVVPTGKMLLKMLSLCGVGGLSCLVALAADVLSVSTLHIFLFYNSMGTAYRTMLRVLHSLALLFQGQKWNTLRSRADTCEFELDQLLLGTLLFAIHFFLFPNIFGFYIFFVVIWAQVVLLQLSVAILLVLVNHFPIYPIVLLLTEPGRVCGGISLTVLSKPSATTSPRSQPESGERPSSGGDPEFSSRPRAGSAESGEGEDELPTGGAEVDSPVTSSMRFRGLARGRERVGVVGRGSGGGGGGGSPRLRAERVAVHLELSSHPASVGEICAECGLCVAAVLAPYAPQRILRSIFRGQHLACPPFVQVSCLLLLVYRFPLHFEYLLISKWCNRLQVWTTSSDWPIATLSEFVEFLDLSFSVSRRSVLRNAKSSEPKTATSTPVKKTRAPSRDFEPEPEPEMGGSVVQQTSTERDEDQSSSD